MNERASETKVGRERWRWGRVGTEEVGIGRMRRCTMRLAQGVGGKVLK